MAIIGKPPAVSPAAGKIEIGPLAIAPQAEINIDTLLAVQVPAADPQSFAARVSGHMLESRCARELAATRQEWVATSSVQTDDRLIADIFDKARFGLPGMIADDGSMAAGIFEYGGQWVRDTSNTALGALHAGEFEFGPCRFVTLLTKMITREGATMIAGIFDSPDLEQFDQMGELLQFCEAFCDWTGDDSHDSPAPAAIAGLDRAPAASAISGCDRDGP